MNIINNFSFKTIHILFTILFTIHIVDIVLSFNIMNKIKNRFILISKDNTAEIKEKLNIIFNNNFFARRLKNAFPKYEFNIIKKIKTLATKMRK